MTHRGGVRLYGRLLMSGVWSVGFGLLVVYVIARSMAAVSAASPGPGARQPWDVGPLVRESLGTLFAFGMGAVAIGILLTAIGSWLFRSAVR